MPAGTRCILAVEYSGNNRENWYKRDKLLDQYAVLKTLQEGNDKFYIIKNHKGTFKVKHDEVILDINKEPKLIEEKEECEWDIVIQPKVEKKVRNNDPLVRICADLAEQYKDVQTPEAKEKLEELKRIANADENGYIEEPPLHIRQAGKSTTKEKIDLDDIDCDISNILRLAGLDVKEPITIVQKKIKKMGKLMKALNKEWQELHDAVPQLIDLYVDKKRRMCR